MATTLSHIVKTPDTCFGRARIADTRIPVWLVVLQRKLGATPDHIHTDYPHLTPADLDAAWDYYHRNANEIEQDLWWQDTAANVPDDSRPPAWVIVAGLTLGVPEATVCDAFDPPLTPAEVSDAWADYWANPAAVAGIIPRTRRGV